jgi:hypothetical protein
MLTQTIARCFTREKGWYRGTRCAAVEGLLALVPVSNGHYLELDVRLKFKLQVIKHVL